MFTETDEICMRIFEILDFIRDCTGPIPNDMKFKGWQTFKSFYNERPIHYWIRYRQGEPIPEDMKFQGW